MSTVIVEEVFVDLIGEDKEIVLDRDLGNGLQLIESEDLAARILGGVDQNGPRFGCDGAAK
jgi:hypothetical protein